MTSVIDLHAGPAAGFDEPLEMLDACHQRVERMLALARASIDAGAMRSMAEETALRRGGR